MTQANEVARLRRESKVLAQKWRGIRRAALSRLEAKSRGDNTSSVTFRRGSSATVTVLLKKMTPDLPRRRSETWRRSCESRHTRRRRRHTTHTRRRSERLRCLTPRERRNGNLGEDNARRQKKETRTHIVGGAARPIPRPAGAPNPGPGVS